MSYKDDIRTAIRTIANQYDNTVSILCTVYAVDETAKTCSCEPVNGGADIMNVNLMPTSDKKGWYIVPKVDSFVMVTMTSEDDGFLSMFGEVDKIMINTEKDVLLASKTKVLLNNDDLGGIPIVDELTTKLNNLENKVNTIISTFNAHTHPYVDSGSPATTSVSATPVSGTLTPTQAADIASTKTFHGSGD